MLRNIINIKVFLNYQGYNYWNVFIFGNGIIICVFIVCFEIKIIDYLDYILKRIKIVLGNFLLNEFKKFFL